MNKIKFVLLIASLDFVVTSFLKLVL